MKVSAAYSDRVACPHCGAPLRTLGRWYISEGEWLFQRKPITIRTLSSAPRFDSHKWTRTDRDVKVQQFGRDTTETKSVWNIIAEYECTRLFCEMPIRSPFKHDPNGLYDCGYITRQDAVPYHGDEHEFMQPPDSPQQQAVSTAGLTKTLTTAR